MAKARTIAPGIDAQLHRENSPAKKKVVAGEIKTRIEFASQKSWSRAARAAGPTIIASELAPVCFFKSRATPTIRPIEPQVGTRSPRSRYKSAGRAGHEGYWCGLPVEDRRRDTGGTGHGPTESGLEGSVTQPGGR